MGRNALNHSCEHSTHVLLEIQSWGHHCCSVSHRISSPHLVLQGFHSCDAWEPFLSQEMVPCQTSQKSCSSEGQMRRRLQELLVDGDQ